MDFEKLALFKTHSCLALEFSKPQRSQCYFLKDALMSNLSDKLSRVHVILQEYVSVHDQIFKPSLRKSIRIPGFFKPIDFGKHFEDLGVLENALEEAAICTDLGDQQPVFIEYINALLRTIEKLRVLCGKLLSKSEGAAYSMEGYKSDIASYQDLVAEYRAIGSKLNLQLSNSGMMGGKAMPAKSRMLINHFIHIIAGLLIPDMFIWTTSGILIAVIMSAVTQGIDQFRIYRHYQNEFQLIDQIHEIKERRSVAFEVDTLLRHGQMFIFKVIWYGLVTMVAAGFRR